MRHALPLLLLLSGACRGPTGGKVAPRDTGRPGETGLPPDTASLPDTAGAETGPCDTAPEEVPGDTSTDLIGGEPPLCHLALTCPQDPMDEPKVECVLQVAEHDGVVRYDGPAGVDLRGRSSVSFPKPQYAVELREEASRLVPAGSTWRYLDTGMTPPADWTSLAFDDTAWPEGPAPLGYGDTQATVVSWGEDAADKHVTTWFRHTFSVPDPAAWPVLTVGLARDDGGAVYLNGVEILRSNLPDGALTADTLAPVAVSGGEETAFWTAAVDPALLRAGENVLAVEVHQSGPSSSDLTLDLWLGREGEEVNRDFFGMGGEDDWILNGAYVDRSLIRNKLCFDLFQDFAVDGLAPTERYAAESVLCDLTYNGQPYGIYLLSEKPERDDDRVVLQEDPAAAGGSFLVKNHDDGAGFMEATGVYGQWNLLYPDPAEVGPEAQAAIQARLQAWGDAVLSEHPGNPVDGMWTTMDLDSAVDFVLLEELSKNNDAYFLSIHLWQDVGGKLRFLPWDMDLSFGYPYYDCGWEGWVASRPSMISAFSGDAAFKARMRERWDQLRAGPLAEDAILARIRTYREVMGDAVYENFEVWPFEEITFEWGGTSWLCPVESYDAEYERIQAWISGRLAWMDANLETF